MSQGHWMEEEGLRSQQRGLKAHKDPHKWLVRAMNELVRVIYGFVRAINACRWELRLLTLAWLSKVLSLLKVVHMIKGKV